MKELVNKLKEEHKLIIKMFEDVKALGIGSKKGRDELFKVKEIILEHLKIEDNQFYPKFKILSKNNSALKEMLNTFQSEMIDISKQVMIFFDKYLSDSIGVEFGRDYGRLFITLSNRIKKEESVLYKEFEKLL